MYKHAYIPLKEGSSFGITSADEEDVLQKQARSPQLHYLSTSLI